MSPKGANYRFRLEIIEALHANGFTSAYRARENHSLLADPQPHGDILGLPITLAVRNERLLSMSEALDEAQREAHHEGNDVYAVVASRRSHEVEGSYCLMPLSGLMVLMHRAFDLAPGTASG